MYTGSVSPRAVITHNSSSSVPEHVVLVGGTCIYRKFDGSVVPTGSHSWNELWLGLVAHFYKERNFYENVSASSVSILFSEEHNFEFGLCHIADDGTGTPDKDIPHLVVAWDASTSQAETYTTWTNHLGNKQESFAYGQRVKVTQDGSRVVATGNVCHQSLNRDGRVFMGLRFYTSSVAATKPDTLCITPVSPNTSATSTSSFVNEWSASSELALFMSSSTWTEATSFLGTKGSYNQQGAAGGAGFTVSQSLYPLNGVYVKCQWNSLPISISDICVRVFPKV